MKSHICVPKVTLKKFNNSGKNNELLYFLDLKNNCICKSTHKDFLAEEGYYSLDTEKLLSDEIETKMGSLYSRVELAMENEEILPKTICNLHNMAKKIIAIQSLRNPDYTRKHILTHFKRLQLKGRKGAKILANEILKQGNYKQYLNVFFTAYHFDLYRSAILINDTCRDFFLPTMHFFHLPYIANLGKDLFVVIMSSKMAWILMREGDYSKNVKDDYGESVIRLKNPKSIEIFNYGAYKYESAYGVGRIISTQEELMKFNFDECAKFLGKLQENYELFIESM